MTSQVAEMPFYKDMKIESVTVEKVCTYQGRRSRAVVSCLVIGLHPVHVAFAPQIKDPEISIFFFDHFN